MFITDLPITLALTNLTKVLPFNRDSDLNWFQVVTLRHRLITAAQETDVVTKVITYSFACMPG